MAENKERTIVPGAERAPQTGTFKPQSIIPSQAQPTAETAGMALAAQAKALVEARYTIAMHQRRDLDVVRERALRECKRPGFAFTARYAKPIGGKKIYGPSIRFVEAVLRHFGNVPVDVVTVYDDTEKRIVRVTVADLESNTAYSQDVTIRKAVERKHPKDGDTILRQRTNSQGQPVFLIEATDDEILNQQNALISKAVRTLGLRLIPGWLVDECMTTVVDVINEGGDDPDLAKRRLFDAFGLVGVSPAEVKKYLRHDGERLSPKERADLLMIYNTIKDGEATWAEVMEQREGEPDEPKDDTLAPGKDPASMQQGQPAPTPPAPTPPAPTPPTPPPAPEPPPQPAPAPAQAAKAEKGGCPDCHAPEGKPHATDCPRRQGHTSGAQQLQQEKAAQRKAPDQSAPRRVPLKEVLRGKVDPKG